MIPQEKEQIIVKFLTNQASAKDLDELSVWIKDSNNKELFNIYVKTNYAVEYNIKKFDANKVKAQLLKIMHQDKKVIKLKKSRSYIRYVAAAVVVGVLATSLFFKDKLFNNSEINTPIIVNNIKSGIDKATLTLEDGSNVFLEKGTIFKTPKVNSNGEEIIYDASKSKPTKASYNYITTPRGGQFLVKLSDGTHVWLNSESQFRYPVSFIEGETRKVELVYGEAYFDVSPSTEHKGSKFIVVNNAQEVEVIGTEFNIKAYKDESNIYTTLVEGKVIVNFEGLTKNLTPGQQSDFNLNTNTIVLKKVDVYNEVSWKEGVFSFERKSLKEIMKVLSRWYDFDVVFENEEIKNKKFIGVLGKDQNIEDILISIKGYGNINDYEINDKTIVLK